jgi:hypothetical protein
MPFCGFLSHPHGNRRKTEGILPQFWGLVLVLFSVEDPVDKFVDAATRKSEPNQRLNDLPSQRV